MNTDRPALIDTVRSLQAELAQWKARCEAAEKVCQAARYLPEDADSPIKRRRWDKFYKVLGLYDMHLAAWRPTRPTPTE